MELAIIEVVVVLPWVPATAIPRLRLISSASIWARCITGMPRSTAALSSGLTAGMVEEQDRRMEESGTEGRQCVNLASKKGLWIRFHENEGRAMGRTAYGVKAVTLDEEGDLVVSMVGVKRQATLLAVTEHGYGKRSEISEYRVSHRGGKGIITIKTTERNGDIVAVKEVDDGDERMIITKYGQLIRMPVKGIGVMGRNTQGVRRVNRDAAGDDGNLLPDAVSGVTRVVSEEDASEAEPVVE